MDSDYIQHVRYKLQKRLKRLNIATLQSFQLVLIQSWAFLSENEITKGILDDLVERFRDAESYADRILAGEQTGGSTEEKHVAIAYWILKKALDVPSTTYLGKLRRNIGGDRLADVLDGFREGYVEPLFDYIDEQIDDKRMTLVLLKKFKHRCEWFHRAELFVQFKNDTGSGERTLARSLYEYLHDQGVQFHIEPKSASGEIDMISAQTGRDRLVADAKLFNPERSQDRGYIVKGFRQVYDYTKDYSESFGYLVIFKTCEQDLAIPTQHQEGGVPFITHNNKTIFLVVIDIFDYADSASKRGKLQVYEITPAQFVEALG